MILHSLFHSQFVCPQSKTVVFIYWSAVILHAGHYFVSGSVANILQRTHTVSIIKKIVSSASACTSHRTVSLYIYHTQGDKAVTPSLPPSLPSPPSFTHSLPTPSLPSSQTHSLTPSLRLSRTHSLPPSFTHSPTPSLIHSLTRKLTHSLTHKLPPSLTHSHTHTRLLCTWTAFCSKHNCYKRDTGRTGFRCNYLKSIWYICNV